MFSGDAPQLISEVQTTCAVTCLVTSLWHTCCHVVMMSLQLQAESVSYWRMWITAPCGVE